jgi:hypothetical protein
MSLSKNSGFVILRLDRGIHNLLRLVSRLCENDELLPESLFLDRLHCQYLQYIRFAKWPESYNLMKVL